MVVPRGAPGSGVMRVAPLAVTNAAALTLCAVLTWVYGTANAQDKGILNPEPLPPLTNVARPGRLAKELSARKATPSPPPVRSIGFYSKGCIHSEEMDRWSNDIVLEHSMPRAGPKMSNLLAACWGVLNAP